MPLVKSSCKNVKGTETNAMISIRVFQCIRYRLIAASRISPTPIGRIGIGAPRDQEDGFCGGTAMNCCGGCCHPGCGGGCQAGGGGGCHAGGGGVAGGGG